MSSPDLNMLKVVFLFLCHIVVCAYIFDKNQRHRRGGALMCHVQCWRIENGIWTVKRRILGCQSRASNQLTLVCLLMSFWRRHESMKGWGESLTWVASSWTRCILWSSVTRGPQVAAYWSSIVMTQTWPTLFTIINLIVEILQNCYNLFTIVSN